MYGDCCAAGARQHEPLAGAPPVANQTARCPLIRGSRHSPCPPLPLPARPIRSPGKLHCALLARRPTTCQPSLLIAPPANLHFCNSPHPTSSRLPSQPNDTIPFPHKPHISIRNSHPISSWLSARCASARNGQCRITDHQSRPGRIADT